MTCHSAPLPSSQIVSKVTIGIELVNKATDYIVRLYSCYLPPEGSPWANITVFYEQLLGELYSSSEADITIYGGDFNDRVGDTADCIIVGFTLTVVNEFRRFLKQFLTNFHEILHTPFPIHVVTTLKVSRSFDKYLRS